jgi:hypothetical protein
MCIVLHQIWRDTISELEEEAAMIMDGVKYLSFIKGKQGTRHGPPK